MYCTRTTKFRIIQDLLDCSLKCVSDSKHAYREDYRSERQPTRFPIEARYLSSHLAYIIANATHAIHIGEGHALQQTKEYHRYPERIPVKDLPIINSGLCICQCLHLLV